jgi:hypothetical protein
MKKTARRIAVLMLLCGSPLTSAGCGVGTTAQDKNRTISRVAEYDTRMMTDDLGTLSQTRRPWRGSRYPIK